MNESNKNKETKEDRMFKVLRVDGSMDFCECCGKEGLEKVFWVENSETGEVKHFGMYCVKSPQKGFDVEEVKLALNTYNKEQRKLKKEQDRAHMVKFHENQSREKQEREEHFQAVLRGECEPNRPLWGWEQELLNETRNKVT